MSELPKYLRKCTRCGMTDFKECMWATDNGGYLCDKCYMNAKPHPQLTIMKSIADDLDGYFKYINPFEALLKDNSLRINDVSKENRDYLAFLHSNLELCIAYLAGKSLGVDLVKVVED